MRSSCSFGEMLRMINSSDSFSLESPIRRCATGLQQLPLCESWRVPLAECETWRMRSVGTCWNMLEHVGTMIRPHWRGFFVSLSVSHWLVTVTDRVEKESQCNMNNVHCQTTHQFCWFQESPRDHYDCDHPAHIQNTTATRQVSHVKTSSALSCRVLAWGELTATAGQGQMWLM